MCDEKKPIGECMEKEEAAEVSAYEKLSLRQQDRIRVLLGEIFYLNEKQNQALDGLIPMTQDIFDSVMECLKEEDSISEKLRTEVFLKYPEFAAAHAEKLEDEIGLTDNDMEYSEAEIMETAAAWERFKVLIRKKFGDDL